MSHKPKISAIDIKAFAIAHKKKKKKKKKKEKRKRKGDIVTSAITRQVLPQLLL